MSGRSETRVFNTFLSTTIDEYIDEGSASLQMFNSYPLVQELWKNGRTETKDGGARIVGTAEYGFNPNTQWYQGADPLNIGTYELDTTYAYDWKMLHAPVSYIGSDQRRNRGRAQMINMGKQIISNTMRTLNKVVDIAMAGNGSGDNGKVIRGLDAFFPTDPTTDPASGAVGEIPASGNLWWQNLAVTSFGSFAANGPGGTSTDKWITQWNNVSDGGDQPEMIFSAQNVYEFYSRSNLNVVQIIMGKGGNNQGDLTFDRLTYMGKPWYWSRNIVDGRAYMLRPNDLRFLVHPEGNMTMSGFQKAIDQDLYVASVLLQCIFMTTRRLFTVTLDGVTA